MHFRPYLVDVMLHGYDQPKPFMFKVIIKSCACIYIKRGINNIIVRLNIMVKKGLCAILVENNLLPGSLVIGKTKTKLVLSALIKHHT